MKAQVNNTADCLYALLIHLSMTLIYLTSRMVMTTTIF